MTSQPPKKGGRRSTGHDPKVPVRIPKDMLARIDRWAGRFDGMDRSTALRCLQRDELIVRIGRHIRLPAGKPPMF